MSGDDRTQVRRAAPRASDRRVADERVLPHSIDAERAVLGALLVSPQVLALLPNDFTEGAFYREAHRLVYRAARALYERRVEIDLLTIKEELIRTGDLESVGGAVYLADLIDGVPRSTNAPHYAHVVAEHAVRRAVIGLANRMLSDAYSAELTSADLMAEAQQGMVDVSMHRDDRAAAIVDLINVARTTLELASEQGPQVLGVTTGFIDLDDMTCGLQRGDLSLLAARPSVGKTALAGNIAEHVASADLGVVILFSLEMTARAIIERIVASRARVEGHRTRQGRFGVPEYERIGAAMADLAQLPFVIDDTSSVPVEDLARRCRRVAIRYGALRLVIVDYLQLLTTRSRHENRQQQVSFISGALKALAKDLDVPVLALSQLSRGVEERKDKRPILSDLRESGSLEQDADLVMLLHRSDRDTDPAELIVAKQRNGPVGVVKLVFTKTFARFDNLAHGGAPAWTGGAS